MTLSPEQRRALELLAAAGSRGCTESIMLAHGFIDRIVSRPQLRTEIARVIDYCVK